MYLINSDILVRPKPPLSLREESEFGEFQAAPEVFEWATQTFLDERSALYDEEHSHLLQANVGVLWTNTYNETKQVQVVGHVELARPHSSLGKFAKARWWAQMRGWFGLDAYDLDFLATFYAPYAYAASDMEFCSLIKHELCHCAQALDKFGNPAFVKGRPKFALKDHDFAGFLSNVRDFGPGAERGVPELLEIVKQPPRVAYIDVSRMCGNCLQLNA